MKIFLVLVLSYLLGSIPFSHIFPKLKGKDVRLAGTKNVGATNALVVAGPLMGFLSWVGDVGKGFLAVYLAQAFSLPAWAICLAGLAAIIGHDFPIFLRFKGGKGIAATGGALIAFDPVLTLLVFLLWIMLIMLWRYFIPATIVILACLPVLLIFLGKDVSFVAFAFGAFLLALYTHRYDLARFLSGQETSAPKAMSRYFNK